MKYTIMVKVKKKGQIMINWKYKAITILLILILATSPTMAGLISTEQEIQLGKEAAAQLEAEYGVYEDPGLTAWVGKTGKKLASISPREGITYTFKIIKIEQPNALAIPGGFVYVTYGLLRDFVKNDINYLAVILGHEIGHINERHGMSQLEWSMGLNVILQILLGRNEAAYNIAQLASELVFLKYSRSQESEADRYGMKLAYEAGYDPNALIRFFKDMQKYEASNSSYTPEFLESHPDTASRIEDAEEYIAELKGGAVAENNNYTPTPTPYYEEENFKGNLTGIWESDFISPLLLTQIGNKVSGVYQNGKGAIEGIINGNKINYEWKDFYTNNHGSGYLEISSDGSNLEGKWYWINGDSRDWDLEKKEVSDYYPTPVPTESDTKYDISGIWHSNIGDIVLNQNGNSVEGYYHKGKGIIKGTIKDDRFDCEWYDSIDKESGTGYFIISDDRKSMEGKWYTSSGSSGDWYAKR